MAVQEAELTSAFGNIVVASDIEYAVRDILQRSFPAYLREVERQVGWEGEELPAPRNYTTRNSFDALPGEEMPKVVVISPGLFDVPTTPEGDGYYRGVWQLGVGIAVAAETEEEADRSVKMYGAATRAILLQNQSLDGIAVGVYWLDENYDDLPVENQLQTYKAAGIYMGVDVEKITTRRAKPVLSEAPQYLGEVQDTTITVDHVEELP
jgi:hypothetical protein